MGDPKRKTFLEMAEAIGFRRKNAYTLREVSLVTCFPLTTVNEDANAGLLATVLAPGRKRGRMVEPEAADEWLRLCREEAANW